MESYQQHPGGIPRKQHERGANSASHSISVRQPTITGKKKRRVQGGNFLFAFRLGQADAKSRKTEEEYEVINQYSGRSSQPQKSCLPMIFRSEATAADYSYQGSLTALLRSLEPPLSPCKYKAKAEKNSYRGSGSASGWLKTKRSLRLFSYFFDKLPVF